jgi:hypothetical protein
MLIVPPVRLALESLDDRLVPSATVLDLTMEGAVQTAPSGAIVEQIDPQPTGCGVVHDFLRLQGNASGGGIQQGYNTDARPLQFDEKNSPVFTHSLTLSEVPVVSVNGVNYLEFFLGVNQNQSSPLISLDQVQIFLGSAPDLTGYSAGTLAGLSPVFDMNSGGAVSVLLNSGLSSGNGSGDMALLVPQANFAGADPNSFLYLYSLFGAQPGASANGGFEQWWVPVITPQPTQSISGSVLTFGSNAPMQGVPILLVGTDSNGNPVTQNTVTDMSGNFNFTNIPVGMSYTIIQITPPLFATVAETLGTVNGIGDGMKDVADSQFINITLTSGQNGINYIFFDNLNG